MEEYILCSPGRSHDHKTHSTTVLVFLLELSPPTKTPSLTCPPQTGVAAPAAQTAAVPYRLPAEFGHVCADRRLEGVDFSWRQACGLSPAFPGIHSDS
ncbi:hypothetical protein EVAR_84022_1 [Eumeta japonica]|uniref:Uncharacterized protein n=1 Tax=Eumeta variegata TaxID=151549 RepID=A0A4C1X9B8_EUMVA|nr:hypothetical protein EVAR_84022_1 [Eumeta japonica]